MTHPPVPAATPSRPQPRRRSASKTRAGLFSALALVLAAAMMSTSAGALEVDETDRPADDQITRLYQAVFGRSADAEGFEFWTDQYREGGSLTDIAAQFAGGQEFANRYGSNPTNAALVDAMYENVLGRDGDAGGVRFWLDQLDTGAITQVGLLVAFADSDENIDRTNTSQPLQAREAQLLRLYRSAFGRFPDADGFAFWMGEYTEPTPLREIALRMSQSPEFTDIYGTSPRPSELVDRLYQNVLGRSGDAGGVTFWEAQYVDGRSIPEMVAAFADSEENLDRTGTAPHPGQITATPASITEPLVKRKSLPAGFCSAARTGFAPDPMIQNESDPIITERDEMSFADLNGDGATDVVVAQECFAGGSDAYVWVAGGEPMLLDVNLHDVVDIRSFDSLDTSRTSADVAPGVVQLKWQGGSSFNSPEGASSQLTTEVSMVGGEIVVRDTFVNGPDLNALRFLAAASLGGDRPADIPASDDDWDDAVEWLGGSTVTQVTAPCGVLADAAAEVGCTFGTPGSPVDVQQILVMMNEQPDGIWAITDVLGVSD